MPSVAPARARDDHARLPHAAAVVALLLASGCGGAHSAARLGSGETPSRAQHLDPTGMRVVSLLRPTPDVVRVSLWIDAGSRDAEPPQLATVSAWAAAALAGPEVQARALPDAIEIWVECGADDVGLAVERLARALGARAVDERVLAAMRQRLAQERAQQEIDGATRSQRMALTAALGATQAAGFFPLGAPDGDARLSLDRVVAFLADHFGPNRAGLIAVGDVRASRLSQAIGAHVAGLPQARTAPPTHTLDVEPGAPTAHVDHARQRAVALAVVSADRVAVATTLTALEQRWAPLSPHVHWVPVRGGAVGVAVAQTSEPLPAVRAALEATRSPESVVATPPQESLAALSERAGLALCAPPLAAPSTALRVGIAATLTEPERTGPDEESRAQRRLNALQRDLQHAIDDANRSPSYRGEVGSQAAHVVLDNGARIVVQRRASEQVGIAFSFLGGASEEHRTGHGRTALLTLLSAQACEGMGAGALSTGLRALGATLSPVLEANAFGLRLVSLRDHWRASLDLVTRCALRPLLNRRALRDVQARMLESLSPDSPRGHASQIANLLSPTHPGNVALWGSVESALLDLDVITRAHGQAAVGARIAVAVVGDVPVAEVVSTVAKRLAQQPAGTLPQTPERGSAAPEVAAAFNPGMSPVAMVAFRSAQPDADPVGARVFAAMLADALTQTPAISLTWLDAGSMAAAGAWAGLRLELPLESLETLNESVAKAIHQLASPAGRAQARQLIERAMHQQASARSEPVHEAAWLVSNALHGAHSLTTLVRAEHTFDTLVRARPHYLVSRGNTARASNNAAASRP